MNQIHNYETTNDTLSFEDAITIIQSDDGIKNISKETITAIRSLIVLASKKAKKDDNVFYTAGLFIGKRDARTHLNYVYIDEEYIVGSNGQRMIRIKNDDNIAPGYYTKEGIKVDLDTHYPNYNRIFNDFIAKNDRFEYNIANAKADDTQDSVQITKINTAWYNLKHIKILRKLVKTTKPITVLIGRNGLVYQGDKIDVLIVTAHR